MPTPFTRSARCLFLVLAIVAATVSTAAAQGRSDDPLATYRAYLKALEQAKSLTDLSIYLPAEMVAGIREIPEARQSRLLERLKQQGAEAPAGEWEVLAQKVTGDTATIVVRGMREGGDAAVKLQATIMLGHEPEGWKVDPSGSWETVEVLPADLDTDATPQPLQLGAEKRGSGAYGVSTGEAVATAAGSGGDWGGTIVFDPRGQYVALGNSRATRIQLFELDGFREAWSAQVSQTYGSLSFRSDGRALAIVSESGYFPEILPLMPNVRGTAPENGYFFSRPALTEAAAVIAGRPNWSDVAYHPTQPILAVAVGDHVDDAAGAIVFQPTGNGLWQPGAHEAPSVWKAAGTPEALTWAPDGSRLAWVYGSRREPGSPVNVVDYPLGNDVRQLSSPDFIPMRIVFGPDGRRVAALGAIGDQAGVVVWDATTGEELGSLPGIARVVFAPDGEHLLAVRNHGVMLEAGVADQILVWKIGAPEPTRAIPAFPPGEDQRAHFVAGLGLSPNGRFLIAVSDRGDVRLWDAAERH